MHHDIIREYMARVQKVYATGETTEHSFRPALQYLFDHITDDVECINEPKMVTDVGRPDFVFKRTVGHTQITVGHCDAPAATLCGICPTPDGIYPRAGSDDYLARKTGETHGG